MNKEKIELCEVKQHLSDKEELILDIAEGIFRSGIHEPENCVRMATDFIKLVKKYAKEVE